MKRQSFRSHRGVSLFAPNVRSLGVIVLIFILVLAGIRFIFPGAMTAIATPFWNLGSAMTGGFGGIADSFGNTRALTEDRDRLMGENAALVAELATLRAELADIDGLVRTPGGIVVGVLAKPPIASYDVLVLAAGTKEGVREGLFVYGNGGVPIGTIREVTESTSRAALFSESGRETHGWAGVNRIPIVLIGSGSGTFHITVAKDAGLMVGDELYIPGPGALAVGIISRIETDPSSPEARIHIYPYANPFSLSQVRVGPTILP